MNKNFEEQEKKAKVGVRLAREEVLMIRSILWIF